MALLLGANMFLTFYIDECSERRRLIYCATKKGCNYEAMIWQQRWQRGMRRGSLLMPDDNNEHSDKKIVF